MRDKTKKGKERKSSLLSRILGGNLFACVVLAGAAASLSLLHNTGRTREAFVGGGLLVVAAVLIYMGGKRKKDDYDH